MPAVICSVLRNILRSKIMSIVMMTIMIKAMTMKRASKQRVMTAKNKINNDDI